MWNDRYPLEDCPTRIFDRTKERCSPWDNNESKPRDPPIPARRKRMRFTVQFLSRYTGFDPRIIRQLYRDVTGKFYSPGNRILHLEVLAMFRHVRARRDYYPIPKSLEDPHENSF